MNLKAFWRDLRFLQILAQVIFAVVLVLLALYLYSNVVANLEKQGLSVGYGFMNNPASFDIGESFIPYQASDPYRRALIVGGVNTLVVSVAGMILTTIVGIFAGIARLSSNWLVSKIAAAYVGVIRNTPLIIQLMFWYFGVILQLPSVKQAQKLPGNFYLTNRGVYMPWAETTATFLAWRIYVVIALLAIVLIAIIFRIVQQRSSLPTPLWWNLAYLLIPITIIWLGAALQPEPPLKQTLPVLTGLNFKGGLRLGCASVS